MSARVAQKTDLFAELLLAQFVQGVELLGEHDVSLETARGELDANNDGTVRHHHSHGTEVDLQVFRELLTASITRVLKSIKKCVHRRVLL